MAALLRSVAIVLSALLAAELAVVATAPPASAQIPSLGVYTAVTPSRLHECRSPRSPAPTCR